MSQLELAAAADVSARHLSFLESGRAQPSREMAGMLGDVLDLPLAERNDLHLSAGFAPPHVDTKAASDSPQVRRALEFILQRHEPYPALIVDGAWQIVLRNTACERLFGPFRKAYALPPALADNAMHVVFHPGGLRPFIENWSVFGAEMLRTLQRQAAGGSRCAAALHSEILRYPGMPPQTGPLEPEPALPVTPMHLRMGRTRLSFFSMFSTFAMPADAALQQMKIECFYPADEQTDACARVAAHGNRSA